MFVAAANIILYSVIDGGVSGVGRATARSTLDSIVKDNRLLLLRFFRSTFRFILLCIIDSPLTQSSLKRLACVCSNARPRMLSHRTLSMTELGIKRNL